MATYTLMNATAFDADGKGGRNLLDHPGKIADGETTVAATSYSKVVLRKKNVDIVSFHVVIDYGNMSGNYAFQESNDGTNWVTVTLDDDSTTQAVAADINAMHHIQSAAKFLGVKLTVDSGTATQVDITVSMSTRPV